MERYLETFHCLLFGKVKSSLPPYFEPVGSEIIDSSSASTQTSEEPCICLLWPFVSSPPIKFIDSRFLSLNTLLYRYFTGTCRSFFSQIVKESFKVFQI